MRVDVPLAWVQTSPSNKAAPPVQEFRIYFPDTHDFAFDRDFGVRKVPRIVHREFHHDEFPKNITYQFNDDVSASLDLNDITVVDLNTLAFVDPTGLSYDPATNTATFDFALGLLDGDYRATLHAAGVTNDEGTPLEGNDVLNFFVLLGDLNRDRSVSIADFIELAAHFNQPGTWAVGDLNLDGHVTIADFIDLGSNFGRSLIGPPPEAPLSVPLLSEPIRAAAAEMAIVNGEPMVHVPEMEKGWGTPGYCGKPGQPSRSPRYVHHRRHSGKTSARPLPWVQPWRRF
jgi:hypothetical protein